MTKKAYPTRDPRPGHEWVECTMCSGEGEILSRWTAGADSGKIRCPRCFRLGWVEVPIEPVQRGKKDPKGAGHLSGPIWDWLKEMSVDEELEGSPQTRPKKGTSQKASEPPKPPVDPPDNEQRKKKRRREPIQAHLPDPPQSPPPGRPPPRHPPTFSPRERRPGRGGRNVSFPQFFFWIPLAVIIGIVGCVAVTVWSGSQDSPVSGSTPTRATRESPAPTITSRPTPTPVPTPTPTSVPTPFVSPDLRHLEEKRYMLELINRERTKAGLQPVVLGDNDAAQLHAESALENCFSGHWGADGLKPYMRYSLAGGYQSNSENVLGSSYCIKASDGYRTMNTIEEEIRDAMDSWMNSPGHRRNILRSWHWKVNIGLAWDKYNFLVVQHFEGDHVEYSSLPNIRDGILSIEGTMKNGVTFNKDQDLSVQIYYDPPPRSLTRGQLSRTYCYTYGRPIASLRPPLRGNSFYSEDVFVKLYESCRDPYEFPSEAPAPRSHDEARRFWQEAYAASQASEPISVTVPWITASEWTASGDIFSVSVDIRHLLERYGDGVYSLFVWGPLGGEDILVSQYSVFVDGI